MTSTSSPLDNFDGYYELGLAGTSLVETMVVVLEDLVPVKMCHNNTVDDVFQQLAGNGSWGYGTIHVSLQSDGICPLSREGWYSCDRKGASWSAAAFRINAEMETDPVALKDFSPFRSLWTPFQFIALSGTSGWGLGPLSGS